MARDFNLEKRKFVFAGIVVITVIIYLIRLFALQISTDDYKKTADSNAFLKKIQYPSRGIIYDRYGRLLAFNQPAYDVMVTMKEVKYLDTLDFCNTLGINKLYFIQRMADVKDRKKNPGYSAYTPQIFTTQLSAEECSVLQEKLFKFKGFSVQQRPIREYATPLAAHVLGDVGEVSQANIDDDEEGYYEAGDYIGKQGIEKYYEKDLRGEKGVEIYLRNAHGRIEGRYMNGAFDHMPVPGHNLTLSIDERLQQLGEHLMLNKIGAIIAIEPRTGEILCMLSSPTYDPRLMVGRMRGKMHKILEHDPRKPLYNRAIMGAYPPGSTFKTTQGLTLLQEHIISPATQFPCHHGFSYKHVHVGCHGHASPLSLIPAIATSCNSYFCWGLYHMIDNPKYHRADTALSVWKKHMVSMGFGHKLGVDISGEKRGLIPNSKFYDKIYGHNHWGGLRIIYIAIGQGEVLLTPLQIANLGATIANRGYYYIPHVVRRISGGHIDPKYYVRHHTDINPYWYNYIVAGMRMSALHGTCHFLGGMPYVACGKTGTAQNKGRDHGIFMGFAPMDKPQIAIAVYVENGGFGADYAVPIGALLMEQYLCGKVAPQRQGLVERLSNTVIGYGNEEE